MWFLAPKKFSAKSVRKWLRNGQKTFSRPKKGKKCGFWPPQEFSQIGQKMAEIWPKDFSRPKEGQKCGFWPQKNFQPNLSKNGQNLAKKHYLWLAHLCIRVHLITLLILKRKPISGHQLYDENLPWDYFEISKSRNGNLI